MTDFLANYKTKTKRPTSFRTSKGKRVSFKARRMSHRRKRVVF